MQKLYAYSMCLSNIYCNQKWGGIPPFWDEWEEYRGRSLMLAHLVLVAEFDGKGEWWEESWSWYGQVRKGSQGEAETSSGGYPGAIIPLNLRHDRSGTSGCLSMRSKQVSRLRLAIWIGARRRVIEEFFQRNYLGAKKQSTAGLSMPVAKNIEPSD